MSAVKCPYCRHDLSSGTAHVACDECHAQHHDDCWSENGGCAIVGCVGKKSEDSEPNLSQEQQASPKIRSNKALVAACIALALAVGGTTTVYFSSRSANQAVRPIKKETNRTGLREASAPAPPAPSRDVIKVSVIQGQRRVQRIGDWNIVRDATYAGSIAALGEPTTQVQNGRSSCVGTWSAEGLRIEYWDYGGATACQDGGFAQQITISGQEGRTHFVTDRGLAVGDSVARMMDLYPDASSGKGDGPGTHYSIEPFYSALGEGEATAIDAVATGGRISKLVMFIGGAGE